MGKYAYLDELDGGGQETPENQYAYLDELDGGGETPDVGYGESFLRAGAQGLTGDFADEITSGVESLYDVATTDKELKDLPELYREKLGGTRELYKRAAEANPKVSMAGSLAGGIGTLAIPGGAALKATKAARALGGLGRAGVVGGIYGLGASEADLTQGDFGDAAVDTVKGAAGGALTYGVLDKAGKLVRSAYHRKLARNFLEKSSKKALTASKIKGSDLSKARTNAGLTSKELGDTLADREIIRFTANPEKMLGRTQNEMKKVVGQMDELATVAEQSGQQGVTAYDILDGLEKAKMDLIGGKSKGAISSKQINSFFDELGDEFASFGDDVIPLTRMRELRTNLSKRINNFGKEVGVQGELNKARRVFTDIMKSKYDEVGLGSQFKNLDKEYSKLKTLENVFAKNKDTQDAGGGSIFGNIMAGTGGTIIGSTIAGSGGGAIGLGAGIILYSALRKHSSQLMAAGYKGSSKAISRLAKNIDKLPKNVQKMIQDALQKGTAPLLSIDYMLQQTNSNYRKSMRSQDEK